jgi:hypothetical protein
MPFVVMHLMLWPVSLQLGACVCILTLCVLLCCWCARSGVDELQGPGVCSQWCDTASTAAGLRAEGQGTSRQGTHTYALACAAAAAAADSAAAAASAGPAAAAVVASCWAEWLSAAVVLAQAAWCVGVCGWDAGPVRGTGGATARHFLARQVRGSTCGEQDGYAGKQVWVMHCFGA